MKRWMLAFAILVFAVWLLAGQKSSGHEPAILTEPSRLITIDCCSIYDDSCCQPPPSTYDECIWDPDACYVPPDDGGGSGGDECDILCNECYCGTTCDPPPPCPPQEPPNPCDPDNNPCNDNNDCTVDNCDVVDGKAVCTYTINKDIPGCNEGCDGIVVQCDKKEEAYCIDLTVSGPKSVCEEASGLPENYDYCSTRNNTGCQQRQEGCRGAVDNEGDCYPPGACVMDDSCSSGWAKVEVFDGDAYWSCASAAECGAGGGYGVGGSSNPLFDLLDVRVDILHDGTRPEMPTHPPSARRAQRSSRLRAPKRYLYVSGPRMKSSSV